MAGVNRTRPGRPVLRHSSSPRALQEKQVSAAFRAGPLPFAPSIAGKTPVSAWKINKAIDRGLAAAGAALAAGSLGFAAGTIAHQTDTPIAWQALHQSAPKSFLRPLRPKSDEMIQQSAGQPLDYNVTGSIWHEKRKTGAASGTPPDLKAGSGAQSAAFSSHPQNQDYVLKFVHKGLALLETAGGLYAARLGMDLPQAGRILSIEMKDGKWILTAASATITETGTDYRASGHHARFKPGPLDPAGGKRKYGQQR